MSPTITGIVASARREGRFDVVVDEKGKATLALEAIERLGLRVGREITPELDAAIQREARALATLDRALDMLACRARSTRELERQLARKGEPPEMIAFAIERLTRMGVLDDPSFARQLARSRLGGAGISRRRLQTELFRKGVDRTVAEEAIATVLGEEEIDETENLERLARKKLKSLTALDVQTRRRRLYAFLLRRGYESADVSRLVSRLAGESAEPED